MFKVQGLAFYVTDSIMPSFTRVVVPSHPKG